ncbi:MAG: Crp/Fnr family transcriptional regulator [Dehalococcoidia bacterium]|nr:Crp/Fnr family transcriptional regulator [Dehalococcoidia bacterium]
MPDTISVVFRSDPAAAEVQTIASAFSHLALLQGLSNSEILEVAGQAHLRTFPAQGTIFEEGEASRMLWILLSGRVRLSHATADGRQHIVCLRGPVSVLELGPVLDGRPFSSGATALDESVLAFLPRQAIGPLSTRYPILVRNVIDELCQELRRRDISTAIATLRDARGRIACGLMQLARQFGRPVEGGIRIDFRLSRQDLADIAGVTLETAIRVLSSFQRQGIIRTQAQIIEIVAPDGLVEPAGCDDCQFDCTVFGHRGRVSPTNGRNYSH